MKKILVLTISLFMVFGFLGCVNVGTTASTTQGEQTTLNLAEELPDEEVEITFWHIYGSSKTALLETLIGEFEDMYPNVTITHTSQSDYNTLREKINIGIPIGQVPTMALGYPDHFAGYVAAGSTVALDDYIYNTTEYEVTNSASSIFGDTVTIGTELDDFVVSYLEENNQYEGGYYYSMPFSKSTETVAVNVTVLKEHVTEIEALGIEISANGYLSHETPLTYDQLIALNDILVDTSGTNTTSFQCEYLMNYDSSSNLFINMSRQWNAPYTNSSGDIQIDNATTESMLSYTQDLFADNTMALPIVWDQAYGSTNFKYGDVCMSVGSTAGVKYNVPTDEDPQENLQFGQFDVDFIQVPQFVATEGDEFTVDINGTDEVLTGSLSAVQQGPNIGILSSADSNERLFAWLFIKYLINTDNTARWAMDTGYLPARISAYESDVAIELTPTFSTTYSDFLQIAKDFWTADGEVTWAITDERWDYLYSSMVANIASSQNDYYQYDPAFAAGTNSSGSATARVEAGYCLENVYIGTQLNASYDPTEALDTMINQLTW
jgi:multiple sugar transport system substrate-binding protein